MVFAALLAFLLKIFSNKVLFCVSSADKQKELKHKE